MSVSALSGGARAAASPSLTNPGDLAKARDIEKLKAIDRQVRAHEAAHLAAAGGLARGGATFTYTRGPDGKNYAVGGEVAIDASPVTGDPAATLAKAQQVQAAALAPSDPSPQDQAVAAAAAAMAAQAQAELAKGQDKDSPGQLLDMVA